MDHRLPSPPHTTLPAGHVGRRALPPIHQAVEQEPAAEAAPVLPRVQQPVRVLVVDDEPLIADTLVRILELNGFVASAVYSGDAAITAAQANPVDIVLCDIRMPGKGGIAAARLLRQHCPRTHVVLFSGQGSHSGEGDFLTQDGECFDLWPKPIHPNDLVERLRRLCPTA